MRIDFKNMDVATALVGSLVYLMNEKANEEDIAHINGIFKSHGLDMEFEIKEVNQDGQPNSEEH